uniref:NADH-ubiquinone oxidoreductase chain 6 n=1 Tax=Chloropicon maureeniae TaxID=1461542 RepID=A0A4D6C532_9CHLO|nr:NADH dehydrogenase subunit 6 [Chloropicon maureeniae]QBX98812.1 NADH dehydrogenase subunit 6 [Chloropicon maureeniae]
MSAFFVLFASLAVVAGTMVIRARNPVYSVLYLVFVFFNVAGLLILQGLDFFAMIFLVVYVGAIAVLFLFVVMMLNIKTEERQETALRYLPVGGLIGILFFLEVLFVVDRDLIPVLGESPSWAMPVYTEWASMVSEKSTIEALGQVLYTYYFYYFFLAGLILLVAMIGAILLTHHTDSRVKRQEVFEQNSRDFSRTVQKFS